MVKKKEKEKKTYSDTKVKTDADNHIVKFQFIKQDVNYLLKKNFKKYQLFSFFTQQPSFPNIKLRVGSTTAVLTKKN